MTWPFLIYGISVVILVGGILLISYVLGERHKEYATGEPYEGGIIVTGTARLRFPIQFYIVAMFFVIFDMGSVFIISWSISVRETGWMGYAAIVLFIGILFTALFYVWKMGALNFGPDGKKILEALNKMKKKIPYEMVDKQNK